ncbi:MAG: hypothetical protein FJ356_04995 [Thaumarchaeota archaeon]|nr:hypothetical protein [Nitrososphaerota archaeon]
MNREGRIFIEFRNELFALFSSNRYTIDFILNKLLDLDSYPPKIKNELVGYYSKMYNVKKPRPKKDGKISYDDILARFRNPLTIEQDLFSKNGLVVKNVHFYHYHALPPVFSERHQKFFREKSMDLEKPNGWRGNFMASAFVVEASLER